MKGTVPPSLSRPMTATSDWRGRLRHFAMCRRISGERAFVSDMFALCIVAGKGLENGSVPSRQDHDQLATLRVEIAVGIWLDVEGLRQDQQRERRNVPRQL